MSVLKRFTALKFISSPFASGDCIESADFSQLKVYYIRATVAVDYAGNGDYWHRRGP